MIILSKIVYKNGNPFIEINGKEYTPAAFRSFRPTPANIELFYRAGVRLFQMLVSGRINALGVPYSLFGEVWTGDGEYDFTPLDRQMQMFREFAPDGYFCIMFQLDTPMWYLEKNPDIADSFLELGNAVVSEKWKKDAAEYLKAAISYCEEKYGDRIYAYSFSCGYATEWFSQDQAAGSPQKLEHYRKTFGDSNLEIPTRDELTQGRVSLRGIDEQRYMYLDYCVSLTPKLVCYMAKCAQSVVKHQKLVGLFFGYAAISNSDTQNLWLINGFEKVWDCPDIDIIFAPAAYGVNRKIDHASGYQIAVDSLMFRNKIYLHEIDHRTNLSKYPLENMKMLCDSYNTVFESIQVLRREVCIALAKNSAFWWFDFFGGYFSSPVYEHDIKRQLEIYNELSLGKREQLAEIAVFIDPKSYLTMKENSDIAAGSVRAVLSQIHMCGAPVQIFLFNDIKKVDKERYKLFVFLNETVMSDENRNYIENNLKDKYKFFLYAPDCVTKNGLDFSRVGKICGMEITPVYNAEKRKITFKGKDFGYLTKVCPQFEVTDRNAEQLGFYENGACGLAFKDKTMYCGAGETVFEVFTEMAKRAGVHVYYEKGCGMCATTQFFAFYTCAEENVRIKLPFDCVLMEKFTETQYRTKDMILEYTAQKGTTLLFEIKERF